VWLAKEGHAENTKLTQLLVKGCRIFVLQEILLLVGIAQQQIITGVEVIDYAGLVALSVENSVIHTWC
jgi:tRNA 2-thiouridine synthesizing protein B